jgi:hypothetical protein
MTGENPWLVGDDAGEKVQVSINSLNEFAKAIGQELSANFMPSFNAGIKPLANIRAPMGGNDLLEGLWARGRHQDAVSAVLQMCAQAQQGLMALQMAATSIALEYMSGDALAQATHEDVMDAFAPLDGNVTLQGILNGTQEIPAAYTEGQDDQGGEEKKDPVVPEGMDNPESYEDFKGDDGDDTGDGGPDRPDDYGSHTYGEGAGAYTVDADNEDTWNSHTNRRI